jgi:hypothetical protein
MYSSIESIDAILMHHIYINRSISMQYNCIDRYILQCIHVLINRYNTIVSIDEYINVFIYWIDWCNTIVSDVSIYRYRCIITVLIDEYCNTYIYRIYRYNTIVSIDEYINVYVYWIDWYNYLIMYQIIDIDRILLYR